MATLRDLLLSIRVAVDKKAVTETDQAFVHATTSAQGFESSLHRAVQGVQKLRTEARALATVWRQALLPPGALPTARPTAPSERKAATDAEALGMPAARTGPRPPTKEANPFAAPDIAAFVQPSLVQRASAAVQSLSARLKVARADFKATAGEGIGLGQALTELSAGAAILGTTLGILSSRVVGAIGDVIDMGGALTDASKRTRLSVESLQAWGKLAQLNGADAGAVESGFRKLARSATAAAKGSKLQAAAFKDLGVDVKNADGSMRPLEEIMIEVGAALNGLEDDTKATAVAAQILGPAGSALIPIFEDGAEAVREQTAAYRENAALSKEEAAALDEIGDKLDLASGSWKALKTRLVVEVMPAIAKVVDWMQRGSKWLRETADTSKILAASLGVLGGGAFLKLFRLIGPWVLRLTGAKNAMNLLGIGFRAAASAALRFLFPLLAIEDFMVFLAGGKSLFGRAFEEIFGAGGAKKTRDELLGFFNRVSEIVDTQIKPALQSIAPIVGQIAGVVGGLLLGALNLIGMALSDNADKTTELANRFLNNMAPAVAMVRDMISSLGRALDALGLDSAAVKLFDVSAGLDKDAASMKGAGKTIGNNGNRGIAENFEAANMAVVRARFGTSPPGSAPVGPSSSTNNSKSITLHDNRQTSINVSGATAPGATADAVNKQMTLGLERDKRQTLQAVSG